MHLAVGCRWTHSALACVLLLLLLLAACADEVVETPLVSPIGDGYECADPPDAGTALGVSGEDLWRVYTGTYTVTAQRSRISGGSYAALPESQLTITLAPSDEAVSQANECSRVIVPVDVALEDDAATSRLQEDAVGVLLWAQGLGQVTFSSSLTRGDEPPLVDGAIDFSEDEKLTVSVVVTSRAEQIRYSHREDAKP